MTIRSFLAAIIIPTIFAWSVLIIWAIDWLEPTKYETLGLGAVLGFLLKMAGDMWQFYFRKTGPTVEKEVQKGA